MKIILLFHFLYQIQMSKVQDIQAKIYKIQIILSQVSLKKIAAKHNQQLQTFKEVVEIKIKMDNQIIIKRKNNNIFKRHLRTSLIII